VLCLSVDRSLSSLIPRSFDLANELERGDPDLTASFNACDTAEKLKREALREDAGCDADKGSSTNGAEVLLWWEGDLVCDRECDVEFSLLEGVRERGIEIGRGVAIPATDRLPATVSSCSCSGMAACALSTASSLRDMDEREWFGLRGGCPVCFVSKC